MSQPAYDTLAIAKELEHDFDFQPKQAEGTARVIHRHLVGDVATNEDIESVKENIASFEDRVASKADLTSLESRVASKADLSYLECRVAAAEGEIVAIRSDLATCKVDILRGMFVIMMGFASLDHWRGGTPLVEALALGFGY